MNSKESTRSQVVRQGLRPDARRRYEIMARKIESAYQMMAAFGRPMKHL